MNPTYWTFVVAFLQTLLDAILTKAMIAIGDDMYIGTVAQTDGAFAPSRFFRDCSRDFNVNMLRVFVELSCDLLVRSMKCW